MKKLLLVLVLAVMCSSIVSADDLKDALNGMKAYAEKDYATALKLWRPLAMKGDTSAQVNLAMMYYQGKGVKRDYKEAVKWHRKAAEQGNTLAQFNLGFMYGDGLGVTQDYVLAHMWYNLAAGNGDKSGTNNRDIVASRMTPTQIAEAQKMVKECKKKNYKNCD